MRAVRLPVPSHTASRETSKRSLLRRSFIPFWELGSSVRRDRGPDAVGRCADFISWCAMFKPKLDVSSVEEIRKQFPALERVHNGYPVAYFDGPGGTQVPRYVVEQMNDYLYHHNANTHWAYPTSAETDVAIEHAREVCAQFLNAAANEIAFGANMTTLTYHLSRALSINYDAGDEIVVTELDHHANVDPWRRLAAERGLKIRTVRLDTATGQLDYEDLERFVGPRTRVVANMTTLTYHLSRALRINYDAGDEIVVTE